MIKTILVLLFESFLPLLLYISLDGTAVLYYKACTLIKVTQQDMSAVRSRVGDRTVNNRQKKGALRLAWTGTECILHYISNGLAAEQETMTFQKLIDRSR